MGQNCCRFRGSENKTSETKPEESTARYLRKSDSSSEALSLRQTNKEEGQKGKLEVFRTIVKDEVQDRKEEKLLQDHRAIVQSNYEGQEGEPYEKALTDNSANQVQDRHDQNNSTSSSLKEKDEEKEQKGESELFQTISKPEIPANDEQKQRHNHEANVLIGDQKHPERPQETADIADDSVHQEQRNYNQTKTETLEAEVKELKKELDILKREVNQERRKFKIDLQRNRDQIKQLEEDKNELLNRISSQAAARMTYNNPNITDLSDQNRPTKISERYSELYDNQWTDAFDILQKKYEQSETKAIAILLHVLSVSFDVCKEARREKETLFKTLKEYIGSDEDDQDVTILEVMRTLKGTKRNIKKMQEHFNEHVRNKLDTDYKDTMEDIRPYMDECVAICFLMNIQEPPMELIGFVLPSDLGFDLSAFKAYTESGIKIKYMVWPAMYLYQNGPILCKGVAQGMSDSSNVHTQTGAKDDEITKERSTEVNRQGDSKVESMNGQVLSDINVAFEQNKYPETRKGSPQSAGSSLKGSSPQSWKNTEKSRTQYDKNGSSQHIDKTMQLAKTTSYQSAKTEQEIKGKTPETKSKSLVTFANSTRL